MAALVGQTVGRWRQMQVLARNWWALALRGVAAILFGILAFAVPGSAIFALVILVGAYMLVDGIFAVIAAVRAAEAHERWGLLLVEGLAGIVAGVLTFVWPGGAALVLLFLIGWWAIVTGVLEIATAIRLRREIEGEWTLALAGIASLIFGLLLLFRPAAGALAVVWLIGAYAIVFGILLLALAFRMRGHLQRLPAGA